MQKNFGKTSLARHSAHNGLVLLGAGLMTVCCFLVLPVIQAIAATDRELVVRQASTVALPENDTPEIESEPEPEPEPEPPPPKMQSIPNMDLAQLQLVLNPGGTGGTWAGGLGAQLDDLIGEGSAMQSFFEMKDLDQKPRVKYQRGPDLTPALRRKTPAKVIVIMDVNERGGVENPRVFSTTDPAFNGAAIAAVKKWKFEPGKSKGKPVRSRMRCPIAFPKGK